MKLVYIDGSGWNGKRSATCIYFDDTKIKILKIYEEKFTNNEMEYQALVDTLKENLNEETTIITDSQLLERQMSGVYEVRKDNLKLLHKLAKSLLGLKWHPVHIKWVPRDENKAGVFLEQVLKNIP